MTDVLIKRKLLERVAKNLATPRQPEGDGLEVFGWYHSHAKVATSDKARVVQWLPECVEPLCRLSDHLRAIAELQAKLDDPDYPPKYSRRLIAGLREECEIQRNTAAGAHNQLTAIRLEAEQLAKEWMAAVAERDTLRQQLAERDADAERWRYTQHPDYFCCGPYDTDGDYCGYSVGVIKHANGKQLSLNHCIEGRGDSLEEAIDAALAEVDKKS